MVNADLAQAIDKWSRVGLHPMDRNHKRWIKHRNSAHRLFDRHSEASIYWQECYVDANHGTHLFDSVCVSGVKDTQPLRARNVPHTDATPMIDPTTDVSFGPAVGVHYFNSESRDAELILRTHYVCGEI